VTPEEFGYLRKMLKDRSGLNLGEDRQDFLEGRLKLLLNEFSCTSLSALAEALKKPEAEYLRARVAQAVTVQESYFFRNKEPFQYFSEIMLPALISARSASRRIRIWCAAAATGQEPYSLAMLVAERAREFDGFAVEIVATDFSREALRKARQGVYSQFEAQRGLPVSLLVKYFDKRGKGWELNEKIRSMVEFSEHNLLLDAPKSGVFDVIFCRNVLIYFDDATKRQVLADLAGVLAADGYLVLGAAETARGLSRDFVSAGEHCHGIYARAQGATVTTVAKAGDGIEPKELSAEARELRRRASGSESR
jgi:chemotaxis protein methyltransferase CheR